MRQALAGWRVLIPRPQGRGSSLVGLLAAEGAVAQAISLIDIAPPVDLGALDAAVLGLAAGEYAWVGFTSVNAVSAVLDRAARLSISPAVPADTSVAAVGPATAGSLRAAGVAVDLVPEHGGAAVTLASIWPAAHAGESVLLPQSEIAGPVLRQALLDKGFRVDVAVAYRTLPRPVPDSVAADLAAGAFEAVLLTSPSTVSALAGVHIESSTVLAAIGPSTARAAAEAGLHVAFTAADPDDAALITGLTQFAAHHPRRPES